MRFPQDFGILTIAIAFVEGISGVLKSKFKRIWIFFFLLQIECICAVVLSAALIIAAFSDNFSGAEKFAAIATVVSNALLLIFAGLKLLINIKNIGKEERRRYLIGSIYLGTCLLLSGIPIFIAQLNGRSLKPFKSIHLAYLTMLLPLLISAIFLSSLTLSFPQTEPNSYARNVFPFAPVYGIVLAIGILILNRSENLSLAFLILSNLYPAMLTYTSLLYFNE